MRKEERASFFIDYFYRNLPDEKTELRYSNGFELIVDVILYAQ